MTTKGIARDPAWAPIAIEHETQLSACLNGNKNAGMVVIHKAMDMAIEKAKTHGFGICGTNNTSTSTGALGYYAQKIAEEGLIAMVFAGSPEFVAPNGAIQPIFGTNPIGVGIPTAGKPVVLDMATSAYSFFGLLEARTAGKKIPHGVAIDSAGKITEDPNAAIDGGAIVGFDGGYKSSNLALMVELLAGPLVGAAVTDKMAAKNWGNLVVAIDPKLLGQGEFERRAKMVTDRVKAAKRQPDVDEILLPGERGDGVAARARASGVIDVESNLWAGLQELASQWQGGVMPPSTAPLSPAAPRRLPVGGKSPGTSGRWRRSSCIPPRTSTTRSTPPTRRCTRPRHLASPPPRRTALTTTRGPVTPLAIYSRRRWPRWRAPTERLRSPPA